MIITSKAPYLGFAKFLPLIVLLALPASIGLSPAHGVAKARFHKSPSTTGLALPADNLGPRDSLQDADDSACRPEMARHVEPYAVPVGAVTTVTLSVALDCPGELQPLDIVLALDSSPSMRGAALEESRAGATVFVESLDLAHHHVGVVSFTETATTRARLSRDKRYILSAIGQIEAPRIGGTDIAAGLRQAGRVLRDDRSRADAVSVIVLLSDGHNNWGRLPVLQQAAMLRQDGVHIVTVAFSAADLDLMLAVASSPEDALRAPFGRDLRPAFERAGRRLMTVVGRDLEISDRLPALLTYDAGSSMPEARFDGGGLDWRMPIVTSGPMTFTWRVKPRSPGRQPVSAEGVIRWTDSSGRQGEAALPPGELLAYAGSSPPPDTATFTPPPGTPGSATPVASSTMGTLTATAIATPDDGRETPTPTGAGTVTPSPPASGSATPSIGETPTAGAGGATSTRSPGAGGEFVGYLPLVGSWHCWTPRQAPLAVAMLVDTSTTMRMPAVDGRPRIEVATEAVVDFADRLLGAGGATTLSLLAFDNRARHVFGPTGDFEFVRGVLGQALETAVGSRLDRGIEAAAAHLLEQRSSWDGAAIVLLTDGHVVGATDAAVVGAADEARLEGIDIWAVAVGEDARLDLLAAIAGGPERLRSVGENSAWVRELGAVARTLVCP